jgi:rhodanese-related sulfurtransferase
MRAERSSTIGTERLTNYALQIKFKEEFIRQLTSNLPARPDYFSQDAEINRSGATALSELPELPAIDAMRLKTMLEDGEVALDIRTGEEFCAGHVPGSINIALSGQFASWAGAVLGLSWHPVLIADSENQMSEARMRLARIGLENIAGYLRGGVRGWEEAGLALAQTERVDVGELSQMLHEGAIQILDVRRQAEWESGHIEGANWWPLDNFKISPPEIESDIPVAVHCKGGYRSMIACSLLERAGFRQVINVTGGIDAWQQANLPVVSEKPVSA